MQRKLATWSTADSDRKFDRLVRLIAHPVWLAEAARVTLASSGAKSPGIDGMDKPKLEAVLAQELAHIRAELLAGEYRGIVKSGVWMIDYAATGVSSFLCN